MKPLLISGAFGFVGTNLAAHLRQQGYALWALDVADAAQGAAAASMYERTFTWEGLQELPAGEVGAVVHLAGKAHDTENTAHADDYFSVNTGLTAFLLKYLAGAPADEARALAGVCVARIAALRQNPQTWPQQWRAWCGGIEWSGSGGGMAAAPTVPFILFSSVKAAADTVAGVLREEVTPQPRTPYGQSKLAAEALVESAPLRGYVLRCAMIHGPGNKGNLNLLYKVVAKGIPWPLGGFDNRRSFASIGNVCAVVERLANGDVAAGVYNIADDEPLATNELIGLMAETRGRRARIWRLPCGMVRQAARLGDALRLPLNSERLRKLTESYLVDNGKIKSALGWERMPVAARDGMRRTLGDFCKIQ